MPLPTASGRMRPCGLIRAGIRHMPKDRQALLHERRKDREVRDAPHRHRRPAEQTASSAHRELAVVNADAAYVLPSEGLTRKPQPGAADAQRAELSNAVRIEDVARARESALPDFLAHDFLEPLGPRQRQIVDINPLACRVA